MSICRDWYRTYTQSLLGLKLANGRRIVAIDNDHFYKRVKSRRGNLQVILNTLTNPVYIVSIYNQQNSTRFVSIDATVVVNGKGLLKTFWYNNRQYRWAIYHGYRGECDISRFCRRYNRHSK